MKDLINVTEKKGRGRPSTGKVLFAQRVSPELAEKFRGMIAEESGKPVVVRPVVADSGQSERVLELERENAGLRAQMALKAKETAVVVQAPAPNQDVMALLNSNEELTKEVEGLKRALERCSMASDDQKTHWWRAKYNALVAEVTAKHGAAEFGQ